MDPIQRHIDDLVERGFWLEVGDTVSVATRDGSIQINSAKVINVADNGVNWFEVERDERGQGGCFMPDPHELFVFRLNERS